MSTYLEKCDYCHKDYVPTRRGAQRFCKDSCRSTSFKKKKQLKESLNGVVINENELEGIVKKEPIKIEKMSSAGVKNVVAGNLITEGGKALIRAFTKEENKPATKEDIGLVLSKFKRYQPIQGYPLNEYGQSAYFDMETKRIVRKVMKNPFL